jgi:hypothetical protein
MIRAALNAAITALTAPLTLASLKTMLGLIADNTRSYTVYTALVSQTGTDTPSVIVLENTLGGHPHSLTMMWGFTLWTLRQLSQPTRHLFKST